MLLDRHHDQHRRQEEDGEDSVSLPPARYVSSTKRRRLRGSKFDSLYGEEEDEEAGEFAEGEEDFEVEEEVDDDLAPVEDGTSKFCRFESACVKWAISWSILL